MKQILEAVQALESDIGFRRSSWILLKKLKNAGPVCMLQIFGNNRSKGFLVRAETKCGGGDCGGRTLQKQSLHHHIVDGDLIKNTVGPFISIDRVIS